MDEVVILRGPAPLDIDEIKRRVVPLLRKHDVLSAYVFGSYARGTADAWSDVDLIVVMRTGKPFIERPLALNDVMDALPTATDLLVYTPEEFERGMHDGYGIFAEVENAVRLL